MIDMKLLERVVVTVDPKFGPCFKVATFQDAGALEDVFDDELIIPYWTEILPEFYDDAGRMFYFGCVADPVKLQTLLDSISFEWSPTK